jgi:threonine dehydrogenase-like Zn-dependent dehydrogenase
VVVGVKAVVYAGNGRVDVADVPEPIASEPDDAVVEVALTSICGSDLHLLDGKTPGMPVGGVIGHEFVGVVASAGPALERMREGDRVVGSFLIACGKCRACGSGRFNYCETRRSLGLGPLMGDLPGAQAESVRVPHADTNLSVLDGPLGALADEEALFAGDIMATGEYAAALAGSPSQAVVIGGGPVGLFCALALQLRGARVLVLDGDPRRQSFVAGLGFEAAEPGDAPDEVVARATDDALADVVVEAVGAPAAFRSALRCVRDGGRIVVVGVYGAERYDLPLGRTWARGTQIFFTGMGNVQGHWDRVLDAVAGGRLDPIRLITHRLALDDAAEGYELFRARDAIKVVMTP